MTSVREGRRHSDTSNNTGNENGDAHSVGEILRLWGALQTINLHEGQQDPSAMGSLKAFFLALSGFPNADAI